MLRSYLSVKDEDAEKLSVLMLRMRMLRNCLCDKDEDAEKLSVC